MADDARASGEAFILIYTRYRERVRSTMEAAGLSSGEAEHRVGAVFLRGLDAHDPRDLPLGARLEGSGAGDRGGARAGRVVADT